MAGDPLYELLLRQSVTRLRDMQANIRDQRRRLDFEEEYVARALAAKGADSGTPSDSDSSSAKPTPQRAARRRSGRNNTRHVIKQRMAKDAERVWLPSDMERALADDGVTLARAAIRNAMKRMVETGELRRPPGANPQGFLLVQDENGAAEWPGQDELSISVNGSADEIDQAAETAGVHTR
jgi:hypothetical protein